MDAIDQIRRKAGFIIDLDGVIYHGTSEPVRRQKPSQKIALNFIHRGE